MASSCSARFSCVSWYVWIYFLASFPVINLNSNHEFEVILVTEAVYQKWMQEKFLLQVLLPILLYFSGRYQQFIYVFSWFAFVFVRLMKLHILLCKSNSTKKLNWFGHAAILDFVTSQCDAMNTTINRSPWPKNLSTNLEKPLWCWKKIGCRYRSFDYFCYVDYVTLSLFKLFKAGFH